MCVQCCKQARMEPCPDVCRISAAGGCNSDTSQIIDLISVAADLHPTGWLARRSTEDMHTRTCSIINKQHVGLQPNASAAPLPIASTTNVTLMTDK